MSIDWTKRPSTPPTQSAPCATVRGSAYRDLRLMSKTDLMQEYFSHFGGGISCDETLTLHLTGKSCSVCLVSHCPQIFTIEKTNDKFCRQCLIALVIRGVHP